MESRTTEPYSPWHKKSEGVIRIIKGNSKRKIDQGNINKMVCDFGMVWEAEIYSHTAGKYGRPSLERLTRVTIYISEWMEFEFYELVLFWNNHSDDTKTMLGQWMDVSHRVVNSLCYWILSEKGNDLSLTTVQHLTAKELRNPDFQERICDYH